MSIRDDLHAQRTRLRSPRQHRAFADELRVLATEHDHLADALDREQQRPSAARLAPRRAGAGPGRAPGNFVRLERIAPKPPRGNSQDRNIEESTRNRAPGQPRLRLYVGRELWRKLGTPERIEIVALAGRVVLRPAAPGGGYALIVGQGMPRAWVDGSRGLFKDMVDGRYDAVVRDGALSIGALLPPDEPA